MTVAQLHASEALAAHEAVTLLRTLAELWGEDENDLYVSGMTVTNGVNEVVFTIVRDDDGLDDWLIVVEPDGDDCPPHGMQRPRLRSRDLQPGDVIEMLDTGTRYTIGERKPDNSGWWVVGYSSGFSDYMLNDVLKWERVEP